MRCGKRAARPAARSTRSNISIRAPRCDAAVQRVMRPARRGGRPPAATRDVRCAAAAGRRRAAEADRAPAQGGGGRSGKVRLLGSGLVGRPVDRRRAGARRRLVRLLAARGAARFRKPLSGDLRPAAAAARLARLRRRRARRGAGEERRRRAVLAGGDPQPERLHRRRRAVPLYARQGLVQRGLAVLEVGPQATVVVSPAPHSFQDVGF